MNRRALIFSAWFVLLAAGSVLPPSPLEEMRLSAALVLTTPVRLAFAARSDESDAADVIGSRHDDDNETGGAVVLHRDRRDRFLIAAIGFEDGARCGQAVSTVDGVFVGVVDAVRSRLCCVRLAGESSVRFGARIDMAAEAAPIDVLLAGDRDGVAVSIGGSVLPPMAGGGLVRFAGFEGDGTALQVGVVGFDDRRDAQVVRLAVRPAHLQSVRLHDDEGRVIAPPVEPLFDTIAARIELRLGVSTEVEWILSSGRAEGIAVDAWVSRDGRLLGRVGVVSRLACRVRRAALDELTEVAAGASSPKPTTTRDDAEAAAEPPIEGVIEGGDLVLPRGLALDLESDPGVGTTVFVHVFRHSSEYAELMKRARS